MTKIYRTAKGQVLDIDKLKLANETAVAVGNMHVNARGDLLGPNGKVSAGRNQIMDKVYAVPTADEGYSPNSSKSVAERKSRMEASNARQLNDLVQNLNVPKSSEEVTSPPAATPVARGNLASSVAKPVTVEQKPLPNPKLNKKPTGPSRI